MPAFGEYTWKEITTNRGTSAIVVTTRVSSELPYEERNITVTLGARVHSQVFSVPTESIEFEFEHNASEATDYPLSIAILLYGPTISNMSVAASTLQGRVVTATKTTPCNNGNTHVLRKAVLVIFIAVLDIF